MTMIETDSVSLDEWVNVNNDPTKSYLMASNESLVSKAEYDLAVGEEFEELPIVSANRWAHLDQIAAPREDYTILWLDPLVDSQDLRTQEILNKLSDTCKVYNDIAECRTYLNGIFDSVFLIISGSCAKQCLNSFHSISSIDSIIIYCAQLEKYSWINAAYEKVVACIQTETDLIEHVHRLMTVKCQTPFYIFKGTKASYNTIDSETVSFLWCNLLKEALIKMSIDPNNTKEEMMAFYGLCRTRYSSNCSELTKIDEFEKTYSADKALQWYTKDSFLYRLFNKALRTQDIETLFVLRWYIRDLQKQLVDARTSMQYEMAEKKAIKVYRGKSMPLSELNRLRNSLGAIATTNGYLSTTRSYEIALIFAQRPVVAHYTSVLFEITIDIVNHSSICFADISKLSDFHEEEEVLFDLGSVFRIDSVQYNNDGKVWEVTMTLISSGENPDVSEFGNLVEIMLLVQNGLDPTSSASRLKEPFNDSRVSKIANDYFHWMLELKNLYVQIGSSYLSRNVDNYKKALSIYEKATQLRRILSPHYLFDCSRHLNGDSTDLLKKVDESYEKAFKIYEKNGQLWHASYSWFYLTNKDLIRNMNGIYSPKCVDNYTGKILRRQEKKKFVDCFSTHLTMNAGNTNEEVYIKSPTICFDVTNNRLNKEHDFLSKAFSDFQTMFVTDASQVTQLALQSQVDHQQLYFISCESIPIEFNSFETKWLRVYCLNGNLQRSSRTESDLHHLSATYVSNVEQLVSRLYHDLGQYYSNEAEKVVNEEQDPGTANHFLLKSVRCYELLARSTKDIIERYRRLPI